MVSVKDSKFYDRFLWHLKHGRLIKKNKEREIPQDWRNFYPWVRKNKRENDDVFWNTNKALRAKFNLAWLAVLPLLSSKNIFFNTKTFLKLKLSARVKSIRIQKLVILYELISNACHFMSLVSFYTPWKYKKISGFLTFVGGIERDLWHGMK